MTALSSPKTYPVTVRWYLLILLLVGEVSYFIWPSGAFLSVVQHPGGFLAFGAFSLLLWPVVNDWHPALEAGPVSSAFLLVHLTSFLALDRLARFTEWSDSSVLPGAAAVLLAAVCLGSWLALLVPPKLWLKLRRQRALMVALMGTFMAGVLTVAITQPGGTRQLALGTASASNFVLRIAFEDANLDPHTLVLGTDAFKIQVLPECSGYEGMALMALFAAAYVWLRRKDPDLSDAVWMLPVGVGLMWLANVVRLVLLVAVGELVSPEIATGGFHAQAGWIALSVVGLLYAFVMEADVWVRRQGRIVGAREYPAAAFLFPLLAWLLARLLAQAFFVDFDICYPVEVFIVAYVLYCCRETWWPLWGRVSWLLAGTVGILVYLVWISMGPASSSSNDPLTPLATPLAAGWIACRLLGSIIIIPLAEELAFRGYLVRRLQNKRFDSVAIGTLTPAALVVSAVFFGLLHEQWLAATIAGVAYGYATRLRGQLSDAVAAHAITNLCLGVHVLMTHQGTWWS